ncbi:hypothetical protein IJE86_01020 [bacterium]|nr:hypothetical protein [bacterium]
MNVNSVSFGGQKFMELIDSPPTNSTVAAASLNESQPDSFKKSGSTGGKILKTALVLGGIAGGLALLRGKVNAFKMDLNGIGNQTGVWAKTKYVIAKAGQSVIDGWNYVAKLFKKPQDAPAAPAPAPAPATPPAS